MGFAALKLARSYSPDEDRDSLSCHSDVIDGKLVHGPVATLDCNACHTEGQILDTMVTTGLCLDCHSDLLPDGSAMYIVHPPFLKGGCLQCHRVHSADERDLLRESKRELCLRCHQDLFTKFGPYSHEAGDCGTCHDPHLSRHENLFIAETVPLCTQPCHDGFDRTRSHPVGRGVIDRQTGREMTCTSNCHVIHSSAYKALTPISNRNLCESCHGEKF